MKGSRRIGLKTWVDRVWWGERFPTCKSSRQAGWLAFSTHLGFAFAFAFTVFIAFMVDMADMAFIGMTIAEYWFKVKPTIINQGLALAEIATENQDKSNTKSIAYCLLYTLGRFYEILP